MAHRRAVRSLFPSSIIHINLKTPCQQSLLQTTYYSTLRRRHNHRGPRQLISLASRRLAKPTDAFVSPPFIESSETVTAVVSAPEQEGGVLKNLDHAARVLEHGALAVTRQIEMLNVFLGFEQANKYTIADAFGNPLGFIAEEEAGFGSVIMRQLFRNHRPFKATVLNSDGEVILRIERPFALINSRATVSHSDGRVIGEVYQRWHLWRRKYDLVASSKEGRPKQFAMVDAPFLSWEFKMESAEGGLLGTIDRNFTGFAREFFTDTGHYVLRMDSVEGGATRQLNLDERAVTMACAITADIDYFSRHHGGLPIPFFGGGGGGVPATNTGTGMPLPIPILMPEMGVGTAAAEGASVGAMAGAGAMAGEIAAGLGQNGAPSAPDKSQTGYAGTNDSWDPSAPSTNEWGDVVDGSTDGFVDDDFGFVDDDFGDHGTDEGVFGGFFDDGGDSGGDDDWF